MIESIKILFTFGAGCWAGIILAAMVMFGAFWVFRDEDE